ncbi:MULTISPECIES: hypothetical protein [unclassified Duganella]|nr:MULTISPECIES: hypothetical protein [unclassified Duganella]
MSRILNLQGLSLRFGLDEETSSTSSNACCACSTPSECACFMGEEFIAL